VSAAELARAGLNMSCVDCGASPFGGGMRCLGCFQARARKRAGEHTSSEPVSYSTYAGGCRCRGCKKASADYKRKLRQSA